MSPLLTIDYRLIETVIPYARNPRTHSAEQVAKIAASIVEYGWTNPLLVDGERGLIAGHGRLAAARQLGLAEVPVIELGHLTPTQRRAYVLADNQLALAAGWDEELLALELGDLSDAGYDLALTGFSDAEIAALLADPEAGGATSASAAEDSDDTIPEVPSNPVSRPGDLWHLGAHRLICGDASNPMLVATLMQDDQAALCVTSPPYGNQRDYTAGGITDWDALMQGVFGTGDRALRSDAQVLVNLGLVHRDHEVIPYWDSWLAWMRTRDWRRFGWYVWDQGPGLPGDWNGRLAPSFEFLFHFNRKSRAPNKIVDCKCAGEVSHADPNKQGLRAKDGSGTGWTHAYLPTQDTKIPDAVIRIMRHKGPIGKGIDHPAVFPVGLPAFVMRAYSDAGDLVYEPFSGGGTAFLAAERTGRIARAVEIAPAYVDVALKRSRQNVPDAPITLESTGQTFEAVAEERGISSDSAPAENRSDRLSPDTRSGVPG